MFNRFFGKFSEDIGIDLGTSATRVFVRGKGIVMNEPSVVAVNTRTNHILAVGKTAKDMLGKTPPHIQITRPLVKGVISDFEVTEKMLKYFIDKIHDEAFTFVPRPRIVMSVPLEITEVERKAVEDAALAGGARQVILVEAPIAAALGAGLPIEDSLGSMIVDIGGGTTEIAVISLSGIVTWKSLTIAGDEMTKYVLQYARDVFNILLGERIAEEVKCKIGSSIDFGDGLRMTMRGRDLITGLPKEVTVHDGQIREALSRSVHTIIDNIKATIELTPPELVADIYERGITLVGGGGLLRGLERSIAKETDIPVHIAEDPQTAVVRGCGILLDDDALLREVALPTTGIDRHR
ncbi:MAG: rod shape-determining protein [Patescibacteria group bacterium]|jgi:rod shape-determining protein MreB